MDKLEFFGELYIHQVRDHSLFLLDSLFKGKVKAPRLKQLQQELSLLSEKDIELVKKLSMVLVDNTLHHTLFLFEENDEWRIQDKEGTNLTDLSDGLCGELYTEDGWIQKYSNYPSSI